MLVQPILDGVDCVPPGHTRAQVPLTAQHPTRVVEISKMVVAHRQGHRMGCRGHLGTGDRAALFLVLHRCHWEEVTLYLPPPRAGPQHEDGHSAATAVWEPHGYPRVVHDHLHGAYQVGAVTVVGPLARVSTLGQPPFRRDAPPHRSAGPAGNGPWPMHLAGLTP